MSGEQPNSEPAYLDDPTDVDLYCLHCGYNLRGLSGDPRRCPECGNMNPLGLEALPESLVNKELARMETPVFTMPWTLGATLVFLGCTADVCLTYRRPDDRRIIFGFAACALVTLICWLAGIRGFRRSCGAGLGWRALAVKYNVFGLIIIVLTVAVITPVAWAVDRVIPAGLPQKAAGLVVFVLFWTVLGIGHCTLDRRLREARVSLQRSIAINRVRRRLHKRLTHPSRRGFLRRWVFGG
jgi:hypothetical protein